MGMNPPDYLHKKNKNHSGEICSFVQTVNLAHNCHRLMRSVEGSKWFF